ncbi:LppX_LprAFG lipoprotein [Micromonospora sp. RTP1Z1]|uniref:LppX_LprAFG lipoprotein n=1 Tax=Micromonospora sp. RTP1Z1 TaxID=2994043 RepID=UPI0029C6CF84|nr:LppX_LprAFG lipoprotein [Micromonospora sp. RTP1Z1]
MRRLLAIALALLLSALAACTGSSKGRASADALPAGADLVAAAAAEMRTVTTARFAIKSKGSVKSLGIRGADGVITKQGDAEGTAQIDQAGAIAEFGFVISGQTLYVKGPTGGWQRLPLALASSVYDPSAILNPDRGVAHLLATATSARTEGRESVGGAAAYKVAVTLSGQALAALVPGITTDIAGTLWVGADRRLLYRTAFVVPGDGGTVTISFREFDAPVKISAP